MNYDARNHELKIILSHLYLVLIKAQILQYFVKIRIIIQFASITAVMWHRVIITRVFFLAKRERLLKLFLLPSVRNIVLLCQ